MQKKTTSESEFKGGHEADDSTKVVPRPDRIKSQPQSPELGDGDMPALFEPLEFKDQPIHFKLLLDGRAEEVKIVEPEVDLPLPEDVRLTAHMGDTVIVAFEFKFKPENPRPYELHFFVLDKKEYKTGKRVVYGPPGKDLLKAFRHTIVQQGGIKADIEMSRGKARLHIRYLKRY